MIKGIGHTAYNVADMEKSMHFYRDILGFQFLFELRDSQGNPWINYLKVADRQFIELFYNGVKKGEVDTKTDLGYNHLCLEVDDIHEIAGRLKENGVALDREIKQGADLNYQCWIRDPDGNRIEIMQYHPDAPQFK